ncbi:MAG: hypothetical protein HN600_06485 [Bacteroidetes bacterium]|jgi:hypothetical protein|nr:hypothetical protein [Bacteroidota bacterium]
MKFQLNEEYTLEHIKLIAKSKGYSLTINETAYCDMYWHYVIAPPYIHIFDKDILIYRFEQYFKDWKCISSKHI